MAARGGYKKMDGKLDIHIRSARPEDYQGIINIDPNIHNGLDYLPDMFPKYIKDPNRLMNVATIDGKIVSQLFM